MIAVLIVGWLVAPVLFFAAARTCRQIRARLQGRRLVRYCRLYLLGDQMRAVLDTNYQPRKENPRA